ncbi:MAG: polyribonucleotide nucleotidyltransferase [Bacteroidales bacterium]|jgi:polyribonucleotide nucleotidyltransferase|nr:polyribonucleotide nucleotidyltransferase [Bacteroidales bacterium]
MYNAIQKTIELDGDRQITIETGKLAKQADGSVVVKMGDTMLLATVVSATDAKENVDFLPLSVDYREKYSSIGHFPGGFLKREARPSDHEILVSRLIDRVLRPLFPPDYHADTFVTVNLISADSDIMPDALAGLAASAAISVSDIPFAGPISEVRVGRIDGHFKINPTFSELEQADIDIMVGATMENVMMVEGEMDEVSEMEMMQAIKFAHEAIKVQCAAQTELSKELNIETRKYCHEINDSELKDRILKETYDDAYQVAKLNKAKHARTDAFAQVKTELIEKLNQESEEEVNEMLVGKYFHDVEKAAVRNLVLNEGVRLDGRKTNEIRPIWCETDYLPGSHGSAIFSRGETQSLTTVTLGTKLDAKIIDNVLVKGTEKFVLHYNFPPFSTGDARPVRGLSRREIGHGNLAFRALKGMIPEGAENPYSIRVVSDILESNGSSSMATVCAGTLALMDCGIKIKKPVSGIAMGLITDNETGKYAILSDILGDEDHLGDMDFKVTGTADGITACQMDIKVDGLSEEIMTNALEQAKKGREHILGIMIDTLSEPREDLKENAPRMIQRTVPKDMIGAIIGPGGKIIQALQESTGATITITEENNVGVVDIFAINRESIELAMKSIDGIVAIPEVGTIYKGKVKSIVPFGAFVEILPGKDGLLHISEINWDRVEKVEDVLKEGEEIEVKLINVDAKSGKLKLSRKVLLEKK